MTLLEAPKAAPQVDEAQLLFQEARQRRRRRWLISGTAIGAVVVIVAVTLGLTLGRTGGESVRPTPPSSVTPAAANATVSLSFRPVLCYASALTLTSGQSASTGSLPTCSTVSALTAANLAINISTGQATANPQPDIQFSGYASTPSENAAPGATILLPGEPGQGTTRYVLGPAAVTQSDVASATAGNENGSWTVNIRLTPQGAAKWDALVQQQFHAVIGVVENGKVISTPITLPTQSSFTSFGGQVQISGSFTQQQAKALARGL